MRKITHFNTIVRIPEEAYCRISDQWFVVLKFDGTAAK